MSLKKKILIAFLFLFCLSFVVIGISLYYFFTNIENYSSFLDQNVESIIHHKVTIGRVKASIAGGLGLEISGFTIKDNKGEQDIFTAQHLTFGLRILPLLVRRLVFYKIIVDSPKITLIRDEKGKVDMPKVVYSLLQKEQESTSAFKHLLTPSLSINRVLVKNGEVMFIDRSLFPYPLVSKAEGVDLSLERSMGLRKGFSYHLACRILNSGHQGSVMIEGRTNEFPEEGNLARLKLDGRMELQNFPLQHFLPYYKKYFPFERATAIVDLDVKVRGNPFGAFSSRGHLEMRDVNFLYPRVFSVPLTPKYAALSYKLEKDSDDLKITGVDLRLDDCAFTGSFFLSGMKTEDISVAAEFKSKRFLWSKFRRYLPLKIMSPALAKFWTDSMEDGWVEIASASCSGKVKDFAKLHLPAYSHLIQGKAKISGFGLNLLDGLIPLKDLRGTVVIEKGSLFIKDFSGILRGSPVSSINGTITHLYSNAVLSVNTHKAELNMEQMLPMLKHHNMPERMQPLLRGLTKLSGRTRMDLELSGIILSGKYVAPSFKGTLALMQVGIAHEALPLPLASLNGSIPFTDTLLTSAGINGRLGHSPFTIKGKVKDWQEVNPYFALAVTSEISLPEVKTFSPQGFLAGMDLQDTAYLKGNIDGYFLKACFSGDLDLTRGSYQFSEWLTKPKGKSNKLRYKGCYQLNKQDLQLDSFSYYLGSSEVSGRGRFQFGERPSLSVSFETKGINLAELNYINLPDLRPLGTISGEVRLKEEMGNWEKVNIKGTLKLDKAGLKGKSSPQPLFNVSAGIRFNNKTLKLDSFLFTSGESSFTMKGVMQGFAKPHIELDATSSFLIVDDLINLREKIGLEEEKKETGRREWLAGVSLEGRVSIAQGRYRDFTFANLKANPVMKSGILEFKPLELVSGQGRAASHLTLDFNWKEHTSLASDFTMEKMDVQRVFSLLSMPNDRVAGTLDLEGSINSQFEEFKEITNTLNGDIKLKLSGGRIQKSTILSRVLTILNLYQIFKLRFDEFIQKGMPYKSIIGTLRMKDGVITTEDLFLDGDQIRISAVGTINLPDDKLNLNLAVEPLVTVDKILNNIPIIGRIITGKEKSLVVFYFTVKGKMSNPEIKVTPLKSLTKKVSGILEQLLGIPQQLIEMPQKILKPAQ